jgi:hypothetical protein
VEKGFSIVIAALIIISIGIWTYSNQSQRPAAPLKTANVLPVPPADRPVVSEPTPPSPKEVHEAAPKPAVTEGPRSPSKPAATEARQPAPKPPAVVVRRPAVPSEPPPARQESTPKPEPDTSPPPAPAKSATQPARTRLGIVGTGYYTLVYDKLADTWYECSTPTWDIKGMSCAGLKDFSESLPALALDQGDGGKLVSIQRFDGREVVNYVYLVSGPSGAGFYRATRDAGTGGFISTGEKFVPVNTKKSGVDMTNALSVQFTQAGLVPRP